jgi:hypothetical protein
MEQRKYTPDVCTEGRTRALIHECLSALRSGAIHFYRWTGTYCAHGTRIGTSCVAAFNCDECRAEIYKRWDEEKEYKRQAEVRKIADAVKLAMREIGASPEAH